MRCKCAASDAWDAAAESREYVFAAVAFAKCVWRRVWLSIAVVSPESE